MVGLGNPGTQYEGTRHNAGFMVVDYFVRQQGLSFRHTREGMVAEGPLYWVIKPQTFMNLSGQAIGPFCRKRGIAADQILVVADDLDLPLGQLRIRLQGSSGGHNGLKSIAEHLGTEAFARLRVGIARPPVDRTVISWVLGRFGPTEWPIWNETVERASQAVAVVLQDGVDVAMNRYNGRT